MQTVEIKIEVSCPDNHRLEEKYKNDLISEIMSVINDCVDNAADEDTEIVIKSNVGYKIQTISKDNEYLKS